MATATATLIVQERVAIRGREWLRAMFRILALLLVAGVTLAGIAAVRGIVANGEWTYSDGTVLYHVLRARDGLPLYPDFHEPPYLMLPYWPVQVLLAGWLARLGDLDMVGTLHLARSLVLMQTLAGAAMIGLIARHYGARWRAAVIAAGLFVMSYTVHPWAYALRFDLPALSLILASVWMLLRWPTFRGALAAGLLLALGFCSKQSYVVAPAAFTLAMLYQRRWPRAAGIVVGWLLCVVPTFLVMQWVTDGRFAEHTIGANALPFRFASLLDFLPPLLVTGGAVLSFAALSATRPAGPYPRPGLLAWWGLLALAAGVVAVTRAGSNFNHLLEPMAVLTILAGIGFDRILDVLDADRSAPASSRATILALAALLVAISTLPALVVRMSVYARQTPDATELIERIRETPGPVLTEREAFAVMMAGKEPVGGDPFGVGLLARAGRWSPDALNAMVDSQTFGLIVLGGLAEETPGYMGFEWWPPGTRELIVSRYELTGRLGDYFLYTPRASQPAR
jgi:hypothetical protein